MTKLPFTSRSCAPLLVLLLGASVGLGACGEVPIEAAGPGSGGAVTAAGGGSGGGSGGTTEGSGGVGVGGEASTDDLSGYTLVWSDEFEGSGLADTAKWAYETQPAGWVNSELQRYTGARTENGRQEGGSLVIEALREPVTEGFEYTSARLLSYGKGEFTYGRFDIRAKLPVGRGTWPAIWMMPSNAFEFATTCDSTTGWDADCDAWPNSGEIDIMEYVGHDPGNVHATIHCSAFNWMRAEQRTSTQPIEGASTDFHVYTLVRTAEKIEARLDGTPYFTYENDHSGWETWPYDEPFYFILNLAIGGSWGGAEGVDDTIFPARLEIDYVRAYELKP